MANNSFVKFENVQKSYDGETLVVKDLNLEIPKGEYKPRKTQPSKNTLMSKLRKVDGNKNKDTWLFEKDH